MIPYIISKQLITNKSRIVLRAHSISLFGVIHGVDLSIDEFRCYLLGLVLQVLEDLTLS